MRALFLAAALLAAGACSPEAPEAPREGAAPEPAANVANVATPAGAPASAPPAKVRAAATAPSAERRCGWLSNPTPANWWLTDSEGQFILATQGSEPVEGMEEMPDMSTAGWIETNGHYGYGCACMTVTLDPGTKRVTRIADAVPRPLAQCRADRKLKPPE